jgi:hypothetical protein
MPLKSLSLADLRKRNNLETFLKKWKAGEKFLFTNNIEKKLLIAYDDHWALLLEDAVKNDANAIKAMGTTMAKTVFPLASSAGAGDFIAKSEEFGGRTTSGREDSDTESNTLQYEVQVVNAVNDFLKDHKGKVNIHLPGLGSYTITGAIQVDSGIKRAGGAKADPKADIILYQDKNNLLDPKNIFISHKKDGGPEAFQQYGGITETAGDKIYNHREVQEFLKQLIPYIGDDGLVQPVMKKINDVTLKNLSIFGPGYIANGKNFGLQNVQLIGQGLPTFKPYARERNTFTMEFPHMALNGDISYFTQGYEPVFGATFRRGRGFTLRGQRYTGVRVGIYPKALVASRGKLVEL